jgi:acyl-coenzyme A thioesterase PaaI-like protein
MKSTTFRHAINLWPPFLFTGIHATRVTPDYREVDCELRQRWYNRNYVGTHYGGSLFSMTDPWYMLMLMHILGRDYFVWDQRASIEFIAPGRGVVSAKFRVDDAMLTKITEQTASGEKYLPEFVIDITNADGSLVARVAKTLYIRKKPARRDSGAQSQT